MRQICWFCSSQIQLIEKKYWFLFSDEKVWKTMASPAASREALMVLRGLIRELRYVKPEHSPRNLMAYQHIMEQYRSNQVTSEKVCRAQQELLHKAKTYLSLLQGIREHEALQEEFKGRERTVEDSARLVGLQLPKTPGDK
ncbi:Protein FMC1-like [Holothuria leucospilota]|uniref:Protein FMC1 homolog n=1 Tax=Holothuria leucospilota TaxID=206669 RepID=A0A9Q1C200_HOLLE|nr:Protein FMC1-like [Holothuria leucospilota]